MDDQGQSKDATQETGGRRPARTARDRSLGGRRRRGTLGALAVAGSLALGVGAAVSIAPAQAVDDVRRAGPSQIALPDGFVPEGIDTGPGAVAYVSSLADGSIYRADLRTGEGELFGKGPGTPSVGIETDPHGRLFVAGGSTGDARVIDTATGELLAHYRFAPPPAVLPVLPSLGTTIVNDVVVTEDAAYFTDSVRAELYVVPFGPDGALPPQEQVRVVPLGGDLQYVGGDAFNANGIETTPDGQALLVVQSVTGLLFRVDPATGVTTKVDLGGQLLTNGDGLTRDGNTLYAVQNADESLAVVELASDGRSGEVKQRITDDRLDVPSAVDGYGDRLYVVNGRFTTPPTPHTSYSLTVLPRP